MSRDEDFVRAAVTPDGRFGFVQTGKKKRPGMAVVDLQPGESQRIPLNVEYYLQHRGRYEVFEEDGYLVFERRG